MSKAKKEIIEEQPKKIIPRDKYWEWRTTIEEFLHQKTKALLIEEQNKSVRIQEELAKVKAQLSTHSVNQMKNKVIEAEKSYNEFVEKLEIELGFSIKGKLIDPYTYEVKDE